MTKLEISLLGNFSISAPGGSGVDLQRKYKLVLAALALVGADGMSRERLIELLWPGQDEEKGRANLRQALTACRKYLGSYRACLESAGDTLTLDPDSTVVDTNEFIRLADAATADGYNSAIAIYRGSLLDGLPLKEENFETWVQPMREKFHQRAVDVLQNALENQAKGQRSIDLAQRLLKIEPTCEAGHLSLMETYAAQGRYDSAIRQFSKCRDILLAELGIEPGERTVNLYRKIDSRKSTRPMEQSVGQGNSVSARPQRANGSFPMSKPTITVVPFDALSETPEQRHFARGITHDIIAALLRHRSLSVINGTNKRRDGRYAIMDQGHVVDTDIDYQVKGTVRHSKNRIRVGVQLIDTGSGEHIWSQNYDRPLGDIFDLQDEISGTIAGHVDGEVGASERRRVLGSPTRDMGAWECYHLGMAHFFRFTRDDFRAAGDLFERSQKLDPDFGEGYAWWSFAAIMPTFYFDAEPSDRLFEQALQSAKRAVETDEQNAFFHLILGRTYLAQQEYAKCLSEMHLAMELNPNMAAIYCGMGDSLNYEARYQEAAPQFERSLQLGPREPLRWSYATYGALMQLFAENFQEAIKWADEAISSPRCLYWPYAHRVAALGHDGGGDVAREATQQLLQLNPGFSRCEAAKRLYFVKRPEQMQLYLDGLARAGVPE